jgi:TRAP-type C4-dicarboxylate transport system substrate-binding protein
MDSWKKLPPDVQKVMDDMRIEQSEWTGVYMDNHVKESMQWSKETHKVEVIQLSDQEKAKMDKLVEPIIQKWAADAKAKGLPADAILTDIRASANKHSK